VVRSKGGIPLFHWKLQYDPSLELIYLVIQVEGGDIKLLDLPTDAQVNLADQLMGKFDALAPLASRAVSRRVKDTSSRYYREVDPGLVVPLPSKTRKEED
jgi:hypothetical protein